MRGTIRYKGRRTTYHINGRAVSKSAFDRAFPAKPLATGESLPVFGDWAHPVQSDALAVHPKQVGEAQADAARKGVPTEFLADGRPVLRSRQHRNAYLRAYGFFDKDAGFSDVSPGTFRGGR